MELYIEECLNSILNQTLQNIEIICIDDGSTDNSIEILRRYSEKYSNITLIVQENIGVGRTRNKGIEVAKGKYIAFMDPDDYYYCNDALESLYINAEKNQVLICGGSLCVKKNGTITENKNNIGTYHNVENDKLRYFREVNRTGGYWCYIYSREFVVDNNIRFPDYIRYQDTTFFIQALAKSEYFYAMAKIVYCYRKGHKKLYFNVDKIIDCSKAVIDLLNISSTYQWSEMHEFVIKQQLHGELSIALYRYIAEGYTELSEYIVKINKAINVKLLRDNGKDYKEIFLVEPNKLEEYFDDLDNKERNFVNSISKYSNIIIYGAGFIGKKLLEYIKGVEVLSNKELFFAVTEQSGNPEQIMGIDVLNIQDLKIDNSSIILIAALRLRHNDMINILNKYKYTNYLIADYNEFSLYGIRNGQVQAMEMM